jgi:hypothetical protein
LGKACSAHGKDKKECKILVRKPEEKKPGLRWEDNIKVDLTKIVFGGAHWMNLAQDRDYWWTLVIRVINLWVT